MDSHHNALVLRPQSAQFAPETLVTISAPFMIALFKRCLHAWVLASTQSTCNVNVSGSRWRFAYRLEPP